MSTNSKPSPPGLPGFYFDFDRGKYFRIQPNHIAPPDAKYSRQAVTAERRLKEEQHDADKKKFKRRKRQKLTTSTTAVVRTGTSIIDSGLPVTQPPTLLRSSYLESCAGGILRRRLGNEQRQTSSTIVKHEWAARVEGRTVFNNLVSEMFAVDRESGQLFALCPAGVGRTSPALCVTRPRTTTMTTTTTTAATVKGGDATDEHDSFAPTAVTKTTYPRDLATSIDESPGLLRCIDTINSSDAVFWVTHQIGPGARVLWPQGLPEHIGTAGLSSRIRFSRNCGGAWASVTLLPNTTNGINSDDDNNNNNNNVIWDLKTNESGTRVVFAGSSALWLCDIERIPSESSRAMSMIGGGGGGGGGELGWPDEWMCVGWKEPNVVMTGDRAGRVCLSDVRVAGAGVIRAKCPWGVSAVRSVGNVHNNNGILVWGLEGGRLFDLRYCKDEDRPMPKPPQHRRRQHCHTRPALVFDVTPGRKQMRYGMAFDYDDQLGIVASSSTDFHKTHRMGLWDISSGRMLEPSPLVKHGFSQPVTCAQFVDLEHRGGVKSLLTASGKDILAWDM